MRSQRILIGLLQFSGQSDNADEAFHRLFSQTKVSIAIKNSTKLAVCSYGMVTRVANTDLCLSLYNLCSRTKRIFNKLDTEVSCFKENGIHKSSLGIMHHGLNSMARTQILEYLYEITNCA